MILIGCTEGMTAAEAARIGFGFGVYALGTLAALVLAVEAWMAWRGDGAGGEENAERPTPNSERPTLTLAGEGENAQLPTLNAQLSTGKGEGEE